MLFNSLLQLYKKARIPHKLDFDLMKDTKSASIN